MSDSHLEGLVSQIEEKQKGSCPELVSAVLELLDERFGNIAKEMQAEAPDGTVPPATMYRMAKGLEYLVRTLKRG